MVYSSALYGQVVTSIQVRFTYSLWTFSGDYYFQVITC